MVLDQVATGSDGDAHLVRVTELDEEQRRVMLALELRTKDLRSLERVEIIG